MELKQYQIKVLERMDGYLAELHTQKEESKNYYEYQKKQGIKNPRHHDESNYCQAAWEALKEKIPVYSHTYTVRRDGMERNIPNICFKVPTGGGKTLLAVSAVHRINQDYFKRNNGFVLWIVPSDTIYTQTSGQLRNKEHPYRQILDRASGGRTVILEKSDKFTAQDVRDNLCVMLLMLQSINRKNKEFLKMSQDSARFESFFPPLDDYIANSALFSEIPNLEIADLGDNHNVIAGISIKHSLSNVMRRLRPITVFDEGHRGATPLAQNILNSLNASFILELSATPKKCSNVLISVSGMDLKNEQMIKLPIEVFPSNQENWKGTLSEAYKKILELNRHSETFQAQQGKYIRPIMVIKAEPKKSGESYDHVSDIKAYLINNLNVQEEEIRIKLADNDEIGNEKLLEKSSQVRYIITKDALKEGWDCSFAYVLVILSNTKGNTALTQFIGRVLRQPYAIETPILALNQCYVYCNNSDVKDAVEEIKKGLQIEGLGDIDEPVLAKGTGKEKVPLTRRTKYKDAKIFLPLLNVLRGGKLVPFDYYADVLADIEWEKYHFDQVEKFALLDKEEMEFQHFTVDWKRDEPGQFWDIKFGEMLTEQVTSEISLSLMVSQLIDKIPTSAWQAVRILEKVLEEFKENGVSDEKVSINSVSWVEEIKKDCFDWFLKQSEDIFKRKLNDGIIFLRLIVSNPPLKLNWEMKDTIVVWRNPNEDAFPLEKNMFQPQYLSNYNGLEQKAALFINSKSVVEWWHRLAVKGTEYSVQGWKREKIYPDFLVKLEAGKTGIEKLCFIETKGEHLSGNEDTKYKENLFDMINASLQDDVKPKGELKLMATNEEILFKMVLFDDDWENALNKLLVA